MKLTAEEIEILHAVRMDANMLWKNRHLGETWVWGARCGDRSRDHATLFEKATGCDPGEFYEGATIVTVLTPILQEAENTASLK